MRAAVTAGADASRAGPLAATLYGELIAQAALLLEGGDADLGRRGFLAGISDLAVTRPAVPGDVLDVNVTVAGRFGDSVRFDGLISDGSGAEVARGSDCRPQRERGVKDSSGTFPRDSGLFAKKKVVLAGPPAGLLRGAASVLSLAGYVVRAAESVEELEAIAPEKIPDLVIFDAAFPPDGGVGACRRLRETPHWRTVSMMLVVPAGLPHLEEALVPGINDFMLAPFPADELLDKTSRLTLIPARRELNTIARVTVDGGVRVGKMLNVSSNGMLVEIEVPIAIGRPVEVEFLLPEDPKSLRASGKIVRRTNDLDHFHPAFGIRFTGISEVDQVRIDGFVAVRERAGFRR